jgi:hypothetical protein
VHAQHESAGGDSVTISRKQRAANQGGPLQLLTKNQSLSWLRGGATTDTDIR